MVVMLTEIPDRPGQTAQSSGRAEMTQGDRSKGGESILCDGSALLKGEISVLENGGPPQ